MYSALIFSPAVMLLHEECRATHTKFKPKMRQHDIFTNSCSTPKILMAPKTFLYPLSVRRHRGCDESKPAEHLRFFSLIQQLMIFKHMVNVSTFLSKDKLNMCLTELGIKQT